MRLPSMRTRLASMRMALGSVLPSKPGGPNRRGVGGGAVGVGDCADGDGDGDELDALAWTELRSTLHRVPRLSSTTLPSTALAAGRTGGAGMPAATRGCLDGCEEAGGVAGGAGTQVDGVLISAGRDGAEVPVAE